uniref:Glycosyl transferase, group 1 n=1 Tax=Magnetococcus massalia (strain MO-1) TaxID=451514 RepID=A0A1S7LDS3_MAGMO|nr:Glycosyl transferase, group 1 [Candidatus Magnetococcus massalia]
MVFYGHPTTRAAYYGTKMAKPHWKLAVIRQRYTAFGGAERFLQRAMTSLQESQGVDITMLSRRWPDAQQSVEINPRYFGRLGRDRGFARAVCDYLEEHPYDLVQSHERLPCCDLYRAGDGLHRVWLAERARELGWRAKLAHAMPYHHDVLRAEEALFRSPRLKAVICNSKMVQRELIEQFNFAHEKSHVIYSGVDQDHFNPGLKASRSQLRQQWEIPQQAPLFLFVGSGFERKGVGRTLAAMAKMSQPAYLLIVGKDKRQRIYERQAKQLGIAQRVRFCGPQQDVRPFYGAADALLLPTLYDPFPNVALEAMAAALPIITSHKSGAQDLIVQGESGLVGDALDQAFLTDAMEQLCDPQICLDWGAAGREIIAPITLDAMAGRMVALYESLLP